MNPSGRALSRLSPSLMAPARVQRILPLVARTRPLAVSVLSPHRSPLLAQNWAARGSRFVSEVIDEAGENKTGHIAASAKEGIFWFDNIFPLTIAVWDLRYMLLHLDRHPADLLRKVTVTSNTMSLANPLYLIRRGLPPSLPIEIKEVVPRLKDGGAFVKFSHPEEITLSEIESTWQAYLKEKRITPWFNPFRRVKGFLVKGRPWMEDMYRFPSQMLRVEFLPAEDGTTPTEMSQESLFALFRKYGKIAEITPQPTDSKVLPKYANILFTKLRSATIAKSCMHGFKASETNGGGKAGTMISITYEKRMKPHAIREWVFGHPRIFIPLIAALVAAITVAVFDPIRTYFIKTHVSHSWRISEYGWLRKLISQAQSVLTFKKTKDQAGLTAIWDERKEDIEQLKTWLSESTETFVVVTGPRGSGKKPLVLDEALKGRRNVLVIDSRPIQDAGTDSATICAAADQVGYRPVFGWANSMSSLIDLAAQGATGIKPGFSETLETQLDKICTTTTNALRSLALEGRKKSDKDFTLGEDEYLEAHPEKRPVVVIDNFLHKANERSLIYDKMALWAANLVTTNIAHVVFLTDEISFSKSLAKALPDRVFNIVGLGDCSPPVAKRFVISHLDADIDVGAGEQKLTPSQRRKDLGELDEVIELLGGRLTDLEFLARRMGIGETPKKAVSEIVRASSSEILKMYIFEVDNKKWTPPQAWSLIKRLAETDTLRYNEVLLLDLFKSNGDATLQALETAELITIVTSNGRPTAIKPARPIFTSSFKLLLNDPVLSARMDLNVATELIKVEGATIDKAESELSLLGNLPSQPREVISRVQYLLAKVRDSQMRIEALERDAAKYKAILKKDY